MSITAANYQTMFDLSGFLCIPNSVRVKYNDYWNTYNRIQLSNLEVSTIRNTGDKSLSYYQFVSYLERDSFINGQILHIRRYPDSNWAPVPED